MHGEAETRNAPRVTWIVAHALLTAAAVLILLGGAGAAAGGDQGRRWLLAAFGIVLWMRMSGGAIWLLQRRFDWAEAIPVTLATALYQLGFTLLGAGNPSPLGLLDWLALFLFAAGSLLNTGSELQRYRFKRDPANRGRLYTAGAFSLVRHPNYAGDILWLSGWALLTRSWWAALIPVALALSFAFFFIPQLSGHLEQRYGDAYREWERRTKRLIPFIY